MIGYGMLMCGTIGSFTVVGSLWYYPVAQELGCDLSQLTLYITISMILMALGMPLVGNLLSKVKLPVILTAAALMEIVAVFCMAFFDQVWMFYVAAVPAGAGAVGHLHGDYHAHARQLVP